MGQQNMQLSTLNEYKCIAQLVERRTFNPWVLGSNPNTFKKTKCGAAWERNCFGSNRPRVQITPFRILQDVIFSYATNRYILV